MDNINELKRENYRDFYSMSELVKVLRTRQKVCTWGAHNWMNMGNMLRFNVQARRHNGYIHILVNGMDLFDIFLTDKFGGNVKEMKDVYVEDLISTIDDEIERIPAYTD